MTPEIHGPLPDSCPVPARGPGIRLHPPNHRTQTGEIPAFAGMTAMDCGNDVDWGTSPARRSPPQSAAAPTNTHPTQTPIIPTPTPVIPAHSHVIPTTTPVRPAHSHVIPASLPRHSHNHTRPSCTLPRHSRIPPTSFPHTLTSFPRRRESRRRGCCGLGAIHADKSDGTRGRHFLTLQPRCCYHFDIPSAIARSAAQKTRRSSCP